MSIRKILLLLLVTTLCAGCIRIEETITLQPDGSGSVIMKVEFPEGGVRWLPGKPDVDWLKPNLPEGVRLKSFSNRQKQTTVTDKNGKQHELVFEVFEFELAFDDVESLNDVRIRPDTRNAMAASAGLTPGEQQSASAASQNIGPFHKMTMIEDGGLIRFNRVVQAARDPDDTDSSMMGAPGSTTQPAAFDLGDSKLIISIACPADIVEHNAHQVKGRNLTWEFDLQELQDNQDRDWTVTVAYRREGE